jgi:hypothetical protein
VSPDATCHPPTPQGAANGRALTARAVILGLLGAVFVCVYTYFNDAVMHQTMFVGNNMPMCVYGGLLLLVLVVNPLLRRLGAARFALSSRELAAALVITLAACCIPGSGLLRTFTSTLIMPHHYNRTNPGWQDNHVLDYVPPGMLVEPAGREDTVLDGFVQGLGEANAHIAPSRVPWRAWLPALRLWVPVILCLWLALLGLSLAVHRQWADHERLPYPIAAFANAVLPGPHGEAAQVLRSGLFWSGVAAMVLLHLNNYLAVWFPDSVIPIRTEFDFRSLAPILRPLQMGGAWFFFEPRLFFTPFAFAYFLASDVSFSLGFGPILYALANGKLRDVGITLQYGSFYTPKPQVMLGCGSYLGMFAALAYTGRRYLLSVGRRALGLRTADRVPVDAVAGARLFLVALTLFCAQLIALRLDWQIALLYALGLVVVFTVMSRVVAETGLFFLQSYWFPGVVLTGLLGAAALGPTAIATTLLLTTVLAMDTREALMPYMANSFRLMDLQQVPRGRASTWCSVALVLGLAVAIPWVLYLQYDRGVDLVDTWGNIIVPQLTFDQTLSDVRMLGAQGALAEAGRLHGWERLHAAVVDPGLAISLLVGLGLVLLCSFLRLRFPWWPIHPVMFIVWHTYPGMIFSASFVLGWLAKVAVTHYGGAALHARLKPLLFGVVAGELLAGLVPVATGLIYYLASGVAPPRFAILPL